MDSLSESSVYSFVHKEANIGLKFFEAQKLVSDLMALQALNGAGLKAFRDIILGAAPLMAFLKAEEGLGVYVDSDVPYFRFKLEINANGNYRCLLLPRGLEELPKVATGQARVIKLLPPPQKPYQSVISLEQCELGKIAEKILKDSYQVDGRILISEDSDQACLIFKAGGDQGPSVQEVVLRYEKPLMELMAKGHHKATKILEDSLWSDFEYLGCGELNFTCPCSKERFSQQLIGLASQDMDELFGHNKDELEITCDYCLTQYIIERSDILEIMPHQ